MSHLFIDLGLVLAAVYALGEAAEAVGEPAFLGELAAGVVVGPHALGLVTPGGVVHVFAAIGAASLFFHVGYENVDIGRLLAVRAEAASIAAFGMLVPFLSGLAMGWAFGYDLVGTLFLAVALSITSIAITVRTLTHLGKAESTYAGKLVGAAVLDDVAGLVAFSLLLLGIAGSAGLASGAVGILFGKVIGFFALAAVVHTLVADRLFERVVPGTRTESVFVVLGALLALFAAAAEAADLHATIGAFAAGLIAGHGTRTEGVEPEDGVSVITYGVFAPLFFAAVGMQIDLAVLADPYLLLFAITAVGVAAKVVGGYLGSRLTGGSAPESLAVGVGIVPRTGVELVIVSVALERGFVDQQLYAAFIALVVVSVLVTPLALERLDRYTSGPVFERQEPVD